MKRNVLLSDSEDDWNQSLDSIRKIFINSRIQIFKKKSRFTDQSKLSNGRVTFEFQPKGQFLHRFRRTASFG